MIILDTNVLSELMKSSPAKAVSEFVGVRAPASLYTTTVTQAEILFGVRLLPKGKRRELLEAASAVLFEKLFSGRILSFTSDAAREYARIAAERRRRGGLMPVLDAQIAAIARATGAELATRNVDDFLGCGISLHDPWARD